MNEAQAKLILDKIVGQVFGYQNPLSLEQAQARFAFDVRLPQQTFDAETGVPVWVAALNDNKFRTMQSVQKDHGTNADLRDARQLDSIQDVIAAWNEVNVASANRQINSSDVAESDGVYNSQAVYRSVDVRKSNHILFSDGVDSCEYVVAGQTSKKSAYSIRVEDSKNVVSSFNVTWSNQISNSLFIQDCFDVQDCLFCAHIAGKQFCIANMQYSEAEYKRIKDIVVRWVLQS